MERTPTSLYLLKYERGVESRKKFYKIGITSRKFLSSRLRELQSAVNNTSNYNAYTVSEVDHVSLESWRDARRLERLFHSYEGLRFRPNEKFDGYDEMFKARPKWWGSKPWHRKPRPTQQRDEMVVAKEPVGKWGKVGR